MRTKHDDFQGIRIPAAIRTASNLLPREKVLLAKVVAADPAEGCRASNHQLMELLGIGERQVRSSIDALRGKKLVTVRIESGNARIIQPTKKLSRLLNLPKPSPRGRRLTAGR